MPRIIDYNIVLEKMQADGLESLYFNSGAFGFGRDVKVETIGWVGGEDSTIREEAKPFVRRIPPPVEETLADLLMRGWASHLPGSIWLLPKSHWHFELHFGNKALLESVLSAIAIDPALLAERNNGAAIEFEMGESEMVREAAKRLIGGLCGSDFLFAFPGRAALCTIHHHKQLWWQTADGAIHSGLNALLPE